MSSEAARPTVPAPVSPSDEALIAAADRVAEALLVDAGEVDRTGVIPDRHRALLAEAGLYGSALIGVSVETLTRVAERIVGGCLSSGLVWAQHHGVLAALAHSDNDAVRDEHLADLLHGRRTAGVSYSGMPSHGCTLTARRSGDGYRLDGSAAMVSGWGIVDVLGVWARLVADDHEPADATDDTEEFEVVLVLLDVADPDSIAGVTATPLTLTAASGSATVSLRFDDVAVPAGRRVSSTTTTASAPTATRSHRINASLALGITRAGLTALADSGADDTVLRGRLDALRAELDASLAEHPDDTDAMYALRARACRLAIDVATAAYAAQGSSAAIAGSTADRLVREAAFSMVCASRPMIRAEVVAALS